MPGHDPWPSPPLGRTAGSLERHLPRLADGHGAVMRSLIADIADERLEFALTDRLCPVANLPEETVGARDLPVQGSAGGTFETLRDLRDRNGRNMAHENMNVVVGVADGEHGAVDASGFAFEDVGEPAVQAWLEPGGAPPRRPDEVNEQCRDSVRMPRDH